MLFQATISLQASDILFNRLIRSTMILKHLCEHWFEDFLNDIKAVVKNRPVFDEGAHRTRFDPSLSTLPKQSYIPSNFNVSQ
jgi:hypothetical protein